MHMFLKAVRAMSLISRAEEDRLIPEELSNVAGLYINEHLVLQRFISVIDSQSSFNRGCLNLLNHHLLFNEITLLELSQCERLHHFKLPDMFSNEYTIVQHTSTGITLRGSVL